MSFLFVALSVCASGFALYVVSLAGVRRGLADALRKVRRRAHRARTATHRSVLSERVVWYCAVGRTLFARSVHTAGGREPVEASAIASNNNNKNPM